MQKQNSWGKHATMKDIAKKAKVSVVTVSRALNNRPDISPKTKSRVLKISRTLNYSTDTLARGLVTRRTRTIAVLIPETVDWYYSSVIKGIGDECRDRGYGIFLWDTLNSAERELDCISQAREKRVDGVLIHPVQEDLRYLDALQKSAFPFVFLNRHTDDPSCAYVMNDNSHGAQLAVQHLLSRGHERIAYLCAKPDASSGKERIAGCYAAFAEAGLPSDNLKIVRCQESIESSYLVVKSLLARSPWPAALFMWNDRLAISAIKAIREAGLRIPQDIALVGYDDIEISAYLHPALTTIRQLTFQVGRMAARLLLDKLDSNGSPIAPKTLLRPELVVRETT